MATKPQPITRNRTCRACGQPFEYPIKGSAATRHYCEQCVEIPAPYRRVVERLLVRVEVLEAKLQRLESESQS
jgi:hypothetical protein